MATEDEIKKEEDARIQEEKDLEEKKRLEDEEDEKKKKKNKKEDVIEVKREDWDKLMAHVEKTSKDIELLHKVADKSRIAKELNKEGENLIKTCTVRTWLDTGKFVIGWGDMKTNRCEIVMGKWFEEQSVTFTLEDGETKTVPYIEFVRSTILKIPADIISRKEESDEANGTKEIMFKLQFANGKSLLINSKFVN